jgi:hypothetical protein
MARFVIACIDSDKNNCHIWINNIINIKESWKDKDYEIKVTAMTTHKSYANGINLLLNENPGYDFYIIMHSDVFVIYNNFLDNIVKYKNIGLMGVVGLASKMPEDLVWWNGERKVGQVVEWRKGFPFPYELAFERVVKPVEVSMLDGLCLILTTNKVRIPEEFDDYHFYDYALCQEVKKLGKKVAVVPQSSTWFLHNTKIYPELPEAFWRSAAKAKEMYANSD